MRERVYDNTVKLVLVKNRKQKEWHYKAQRAPKGTKCIQKQAKHK
jgi:hypothetical protein